MKILLTGASGFIGSHLVKYFIGRGHEVYGTWRRTLQSEVPGCHYVRIDLSRENLEPARYDCVIHCAAQVENGDTWDYVKNCLLVTKRLLTFCENQKVGQFIFMSSIAVYGEGGGTVVNENTKGVNLDTYGLVKRLCEGLVQDSSIRHRNVIRLSRILGPKGFGGLGGRFLANSARKMVNDEPVSYTNGDILYNNMFYITDLAKLCELFMTREQDGYNCVGVGAANPLPIRDILCWMRSEMKSSSELREERGSHAMTVLQIDTGHLESLGFQALSVAETISRFSEDALRQYNGRG